MPTPHRLVDQAADGLADGAKTVVGSLAEGLKGAGQAIMRALDPPPQQFLGREGPHRIVDRFNNGVVDGAKNAYQEGVHSLQITGEGIARALDHPAENVGVPPDIGGLGPSFPKPPLPRW